jgi:hypothetical protein
MLLYIGLTFSAIVAFVLLYALIAKKEYSIISEIIIDKNNDIVFNYVKHLKNQIYYNKWVMADPNIKMTYTGTDGNVGFMSAWESTLRDVGIGEQEIIKIIEGKGYEAELRFEKPFKGTSHVNIMIYSITDNQSKMITTLNTRTDFPMNIMIPLIRKMLQKDMNQNAANLKHILETNI